MEQLKEIGVVREMIVEFAKSIKIDTPFSERTKGLIEIMHYCYENLDVANCNMIEEEMIHAMDQADLAISLEGYKHEG